MSGDETVGIRELRQNLSAVLRRAEAGERLVVTDRNRPVAEIGPVNGAPAGLARLIAERRVTPPVARIEFDPIPLRGTRERPASAALEFVRGENG